MLRPRYAAGWCECDAAGVGEATWSYPNVHGDISATTSDDKLPDNSSGDADYGRVVPLQREQWRMNVREIRAIRLAGGAGAALALLALSACGSGRVEIQYSGPLAGEVTACAEIASAGALRSDDGVPGRIWIDSVIAEQTSGDSSLILYSIQGATHAMDGSGEKVYEWECALQKDIREMRLIAQLQFFELASD